MIGTRRVLTLGFLLLFSVSALPAALPTTPDFFPWKDGEQLDYEIRWGVVLAAEAKFTAHQPSPGRWRFDLDLQSRGVVDTVVPIEDHLYSEIEAAPWRSLEYGSDRSEGQSRRKFVIDIDYARKTGTVRDAVKKTTVSFPVPNDAMDDLGSVLYEARRIDWKPGLVHLFRVYDGPEVIRGEGVLLRKEAIVVPGLPGPIPCLVVHLRPLYDDPAKNTHGYGTTLWIRDDASRVPLRADLKVGFGTFTLQWVPEGTLPGPG